VADDRPLAGRRVVVTSGPTHEPIDPVRYIANRSSGKQGHANCRRSRRGRARRWSLISGPVDIPDPPGVTTIKVETAREMLDAVEEAMPADCAIFAAAVADWRVSAPGREKIKKGKDKGPGAVAHRESGHPRDHRAAQGQAAAARDRLCRGDRGPHRQCPRQARAQGLRLDRRQRCLARDRDHGRRPQPRAPRHRRRRRILAAAVEDEVARALVGRITAALQGG